MRVMAILVRIQADSKRRAIYSHSRGQLKWRATSWATQSRNKEINGVASRLDRTVTSIPKVRWRKSILGSNRGQITRREIRKAARKAARMKSNCQCELLCSTAVATQP